jgi:hypothetical protein
MLAGLLEHDFEDAPALGVLEVEELADRAGGGDPSA